MTAYEMRILDWSSDVCSSDLVLRIDGQDLGLYGRVLIRHALSLQVIVERAARQLCRFEQGLKRILLPQSSHEPRFFCAAARFCRIKASSFFSSARSAERRVGQECVSTCSSGWCPVTFN